jgi:hypothetical protein
MRTRFLLVIALVVSLVAGTSLPKAQAQASKRINVTTPPPPAVSPNQQMVTRMCNLILFQTNDNQGQQKTLRQFTPSQQRGLQQELTNLRFLATLSQLPVASRNAVLAQFPPSQQADIGNQLVLLPLATDCAQRKELIRNPPPPPPPSATPTTPTPSTPSSSGSSSSGSGSGGSAAIEWVYLAAAGLVLGGRMLSRRARARKDPAA